MLSITLIGAKAVSIKVLDKAGKAIPDVTITDGKHKLFTNSTGQATLNSNADSLYLSKLGYEKLALNINAISNIIYLKEKPIVLGTVKVIRQYEPSYNNALDKITLEVDDQATASAPLEALLKESSVYSIDSSLLGESKAVSILGGLSRHTLIVLDNVPLNAQGESMDLATLPLQNVKRIEIVKGNSSLYAGSSAIGGIVYLFTDNVNNAHPLRLEQETSFGSFNQTRQAYTYEQQAQMLSYKVSLNRLSGDNDFIYKPRPWWNLSESLKRENNYKQQQNVSLKISSAQDFLNWQYKLDKDDVYRQLPGPVNFLDIYAKAYLTGQSLRHSFNLGLQRNSFGNNLLLWQNEDNTEYNNTNAPNPVYSTQYRQTHVQKGLKNKFDYTYATIKSSLSCEFSSQSYQRKDVLYPLLSLPKYTRRQQAVSLQASTDNEFQLFTNSLQTGFRLDKVTGFGTFTSWRIEDVIKREGILNWDSGIYIGNGYSLPSFYDLYWKGDAQSLGNPDLEPETSVGYGGWTGLSYAQNTCKVSYYHSEVTKLIQWRQTYLYGTAWKPMNIGKAELINWEFSLALNPLKWLNLNSSLTLTDAKDKNRDAYLTYTPNSKWNSDLSFSHLGANLKLMHEQIGKQWLTPDNLIDPIKAVNLFHSAIGYNYAYHKFNANVNLRLNNLFDKQYEVYAYVPQPGFNWLCGISLRYDL